MQRTWGFRIKRTVVAMIGAAAVLAAVQCGAQVADGAASVSATGATAEPAPATPSAVGPGNEDWN
nr:hypothetical protein OG461_16835 [Streptomyces sp. NBC_00995]